MSSTREPSAALDRLARAAGSVPVPEEDDRALARFALATGKARARTRSRQRALAWSTACVAVLAVGGTAASGAFTSRPIAASTLEAPPPTSPPQTIALGQFDRAHVASSASLTIEAVAPHAVKLRLDDGSALFDVEPGRARRFEVATPLGTVFVRGTVFAVGVRPPNDLSVRVYEGRVEVTSGDGVREVTADDALHRGAGVALPRDLERRAQAVASARLDAARTSRPLDRSTASHDDLETARAGEDDGALVPSSVPRSSERPRELARATPELARTRPAGGTPSLEALRAMCARGEHRAVIETMTRVSAPTARRDEWYMVLGDAHRGLSQTREAASAYRTAAAHATPSRAAVAGLLAAQQLSELGDASGALAMLYETQATTLGAAVDEPASALEMELLVRLGRSDEARRAAVRYLAAFPAGPRERRATEVSLAQ